MKKWDGYMHGINIGGWLSQCPHTKEHYDRFITEEDFKTIRSWGLDHVRLPIDYNLVQDRNGDFIPENFRYIDNALAWAHNAGLNVVLDLHKTAGYSFDKGEGEGRGFFNDESLIRLFLELWEELSKRYAQYEDFVTFELLNEVVNEEDNEPWMKIAKRAFDIIRKYSKDIKVMYGSYWNNSVYTVKHCALPFDENVVYDMHCYDPLVFTHQGAHWLDGMPSDFRLPYPLTKADFAKEAVRTKLNAPNIDLPSDAGSAAFFEEIMKDAIKTAEERNVILYCGEYGVIDLADNESTLNWYRDIHTVLKKYNIGSAAWSYKAMNFGFVLGSVEPVREQMLKLM